MKSIALTNNEEVFDFVKRENAPTCLLAADPAVAKREHIIGEVTASTPAATPTAILPAC